MPLRVLPESEHPISRELIAPEAATVIHELSQKGHTAYLVGGGVRDLLLGNRPKDFDVSTSARPEEVRRIFRHSRIIGRRFRLVHVVYGRKQIEVATFRRPAPEAAGVEAEAGVEAGAGKPAEKDLLMKEDNLFGTPEEDAFRRDFTMNGLFYDLEKGNILDYVGGAEDVDRKIIRSIGDPAVRFREDPVRMIRAFRLAARLGFEIAPGDREAIAQWGVEIQKSSPSRLVEEFYRLLEQGASSRSLALLREHKFLELLVPDLTARLRDEAVWAQTERELAALDQVDRNRWFFGRSLALAAFLNAAVEDALRKHRDASPHGFDAGLAIFQEIQTLTKGLPFTRLDRMFAHQAILVQHRLTRSRPQPKNLPRFTRQPYFPVAMSLYWVRTQAASGALAEVERWQEAVPAHAHGQAGDRPVPRPATPPGEVPVGMPGGRRRRRRGGRGRGRREGMREGAPDSALMEREAPVTAADVYKSLAADGPVEEDPIDVPPEDRQPRSLAEREAAEIDEVDGNIAPPEEPLESEESEGMPSGAPHPGAAGSAAGGGGPKRRRRRRGGRGRGRGGREGREGREGPRAQSGAPVPQRPAAPQGPAPESPEPESEDLPPGSSEDEPLEQAAPESESSSKKEPRRPAPASDDDEEVPYSPFED